MAKRTGEEIVRVDGWHRQPTVEECISWKGWPAKAIYLASWQQILDIAEEMLYQESVDWQDYCDSGYYD